MKNLFSALLIVFLLCSCESTSSSPDYEKSNRTYSNINQTILHRTKGKKLRHTKPSEMMQVGVSKQLREAPSINDEEIYYGNNQDYASNDDAYSGHFKVGNPYEIQGVSYFPQNYEDYQETGVASWYGADFHGKPTANGEIYDSNTMTAAHPTLPLPSMVRVTNLNNGVSVIVRVNDRGPFSKNRVIDVSEKAADALGFKGNGTTEVKIELLRNDTDELLQKLKIIN